MSPSARGTGRPGAPPDSGSRLDPRLDPRLSAAVEETAASASRCTALSSALARRDWTVATCESLTAGTIATVLAAAPEASDWLAGGIVAYQPQVKFGLLGVEPGPVVTEACARTMAEAGARLLGADLCLALTGVGGPHPDEGQPPGTVWFAVRSPAGTVAERRIFDGSPAQVVVAATAHGLRLLERSVADG